MNMQLSANARYSRFGRGAVKIQAKPGFSLSLDEMATAAPAIFADHAHESRSSRFAHIPTHELLGAMADNGFLPVSVAVGGSKDAEKRAFTKHMIRFRQAESLTKAMDTLGAVIPEIVLLNAHDGTSSYQLHAGLFRLVCLNGLIVAAGNMASVKVGHRGNALDKVIEGSFTVLSEAKETLPRAEAMAAIELTEPEQLVFARAAAALRFDPQDTSKQVDPARIIRPRRIADNRSDLWTVYNRAQESIIRGGFDYRTENSNGRMEYRAARAVNNVADDVRLNRALWQLAESMAELKGHKIAA